MSDVPAIVLVEAGDEAWWAGDRRAARDEWRAALEAADGTPQGRAAEAMARIRLLRVSGNLGPFVHEAALDRALAACPSTEPWCDVAWADWDLYMPPFVGANPQRVPGRLAGNPLPAAADRVDQAVSGRRPPDPGTWVLGIGVSGAPGAGLGASARFSHPDFLWHQDRLDLSAALDSLGGRGLSAALTTHGDIAWQVSAGASRSVGYAWFGGDPTAFEVGVERVATGTAVRLRGAAIQLGVTTRAEHTDGALAWEAGPYGAFTATAPQATARLGSEANFGTYTHLLVHLDLRATPSVAGGTLAVRAYGAAAPLSDTPYWRLPEAGGSTLLRGEPAGRWRSPTLFAVQAEARYPLFGPLEAAAFVDTAHIDGWHATVGGGVRIVLPPDRMNTTRLDIGLGPGSWGVVIAWGEAF